MVAPPDRRLIPGFAVTEPSLGCQAETGEEFQGPINGGHPDFRIGFRHLGMDLGEILMAGRTEENLEDLFPLFGRLQPLFGNP